MLRIRQKRGVMKYIFPLLLSLPMVNLSVVFHQEEFGVPRHLIGLVKSLYEDSQTAVKIDNTF